MRIWVYTIVRNEGALWHWWLRHYASFCERIIVYDDHSDDGTPELAKWFGAEIRSLPYTGLHDGMQAAFSSEMYKEARGQADFVIVVDGDEFLYGPIDPAWTFPRPQGYQMFAGEIPSVGEPGQIYDYCRRGYAYDLESKPCIFRPHLDVQFNPGRHTARIPFRETSTDLKLLHYRWFGRDYMVQRSAKNNARIPREVADTRWGWDTFPQMRDLVAGDLEKVSLVWAKEII